MLFPHKRFVAILTGERTETGVQLDVLIEVLATFKGLATDVTGVDLRIWLLTLLGSFAHLREVGLFRFGGEILLL